VIPVNPYRRAMVGNVLLFFSLLASSVSLKTPLPAYLPPAFEARERLIERMKELEVFKKRRVRREDPKYLLYLAYTVIMKEVIRELEGIGKTFQELFGVIGGDYSKFLIRTKSSAVIEYISS
jgi:hypothetical protein